MKTKLLVVIIAIVLVIAVAGSCFALYKIGATDREVTIRAGYQVVNLQINNGANSAAQGAITLSGFSPAEGHTTQTVDVTLAVDNAALADGVHGVFSVGLTGDLASQLDVTVNTLTAANGSIAADISTAALGTGHDVALSATPVFVRLTFALKAAALADFSLAADKTASLTLDWTIAAGTVFTYSNTAYYLVGTINGATSWIPGSGSVLLPVNDHFGTDNDNNKAIATGVTLKNGDSFKVVWNYYAENSQSAQWYGGPSGDNVTCGQDGTYSIFLYDNNGYHVSIQRTGD